MYNQEIWLGYFWYTNSWVPDPHPLLPPFKHSPVRVDMRKASTVIMPMRLRCSREAWASRHCLGIWGALVRFRLGAEFASPPGDQSLSTLSQDPVKVCPILGQHPTETPRPLCTGAVCDTNWSKSP